MQSKIWRIVVVFAAAAMLIGMSLFNGQPAAVAADGTVSVMAVWGGQELEVFREMIKPFEEETGYSVEYEGTRDLDAVLTTRVEAGNPPDIAGLPGPGKMAEFARDGQLVDLSTVLDMATMKSQYGESWIALGTVDDQYVGLFTKAAIKGLIWYSPKQKEALGFSIPETWDEMLATSKEIADQGIKPWSIGLESGSASGWVGTDWLENIFLKMYGPDLYQDWYEGELAWTSDEVRQVWEAWGQIVANEEMVYGGPQYILSTNFGQAHAPLFSDPPRAVFHQQASFIQGFITDQFPDLKPVEDFMFFGFPEITAEYAKSVEAAGDVFGMFNDTPEAKAFMEYLATPEAQAYWGKTGGLSPNKEVTLDAYPDEITKESARILNESEMVVFDASDMMPGEMNNAFWTGVLNYVEDPASLDSVLEQLENIREEAY